MLILHVHELTHAEEFSVFQLGASKMYWVKSGMIKVVKYYIQMYVCVCLEHNGLQGTCRLPPFHDIIEPNLYMMHINFEIYMDIDFCAFHFCP